MATEIIMPQLGLTMSEGIVGKWLKQEGDPVKKGEPLLEVETDKISKEIESIADGVLLRLVIPAGEIVPVRTVLGYIGLPGEEVDSPAAEQVAASVPALVKPTEEVPDVKVAIDGWVKASPLARRIANEHSLDLLLLTGTGPDGRIVERDVKAALASPRPAASPLAAKLAEEYSVELSAIKKDGRIMSADIMAAKAQHSTQAECAAEGSPLTGMRKVISERLTQSWRVPHVHMTAEVDMSAASEMKKRLLAVRNEKLSFTELVVRACAQALMDFPAVNSALVDGQVYCFASAHIGVAVAVDNGLVVPVVKDAQTKNLAALRAEIAFLGDQARSRTLSPDAMTGGTFTVTNLGMYGVDHFTPVINPPEAAILGVCRAIEKAVVLNGQITVKPMMNICLSFDHRLVDGAAGARFLSRIKSLLEEPLLML